MQLPNASLSLGFNEVELIIGKTIRYLSIPAVVGHEEVFMRYLEDSFAKLGLNTYQMPPQHEMDQSPRLLEIHGDKPHSAIICAHIDRHGLISLGKNEYAYAAQYMREIKYGEENRSSITELRGIAERFEDEIVYAYDDLTGDRLGRGMIKPVEKYMPNGDSLFKVLGMKSMRQGRALAYSRTARFEKGELKGQIDNALSIGVIFALFKNGFQGTALLTTEEEIGKSWIHICDWLDNEALETKNLLVMDTSPYKEESPIENGTIVLRNRDKSEFFDKDLTQKLKQKCEELNIPYQLKDEILIKRGWDETRLGSTELGRVIQNSQGRWSGTTIQIPTTMYHTSNETTSVKAIRNYYRFLKNILIDDPLHMDIRPME